MPGYSPHLRVTPPAGAALDFDFDAIERLTVQKLVIEPLFETKETVRRRLRNISYGWRLTGIFEWVISPGSISEAFPDPQHATSGIVALFYWINRRDVTLALNMNGGGTPYRDCVMTAASRGYVEDKHVLGLWHLELSCIDPISEDSLPPEALQSPLTLMGWSG